MSPGKAKYLEEVVNEVVAQHPDKLLDIKRGIRSSIDFLVTEVMHKVKVKTNPSEIRRLILKKL